MATVQFRVASLALLTGAALYLIGGCGGGGGGGAIVPGVTASDQQASPANEVIVASVVSDGAGWIVIHEDAAGSPGAILGQSALTSGTNTNVKVTLNRDIVSGETLYAMLHTDAGTVGTFEGTLDVPVKDAAGTIIAAPFKVTLPPVSSVTANNQALTTFSTVVTVAEAVSGGAGWIVIHEENAGSPGTILGQSALSSGTNTSVQVTLSRPATSGETLYAMLHTDAGTVGTFEGSVDVPVKDGTGTIIAPKFVVTVGATVPAVRFTLLSQGITAFIWNRVEPAAFNTILGSGTQNQILTLTQGWRYEIDNQVASIHPFELLTIGASALQDVVLASQKTTTTGSFENDANVNWTSSGNKLQFTLTSGLAGKLTGYRCGVHVGSMRGNIVIQ